MTGYPITYLAHGKQYVAVSVGNSLASSSINRLAEELRPATPATCSCLRFPNNQRSIERLRGETMSFHARLMLLLGLCGIAAGQTPATRHGYRSELAVAFPDCPALRNEDRR